MPVTSPDSGPQEAVSDLREQVREDARRLRGLMRGLRAGLAAGALALHLAATLAVTWVVFTEAFPYPAMYPLMGLILWLFAAFRFFAQALRRHVAAAALVLFNLAILAFWGAVLVDQVPGRPVVIEGRVVLRPDLPILVVPVAMYGVAALAIAVQTGVSWWQRRRERSDRPW